MAPRRVIADSDDDEEEMENPSSLAKHEADPPEHEPLSPLHKPSSPAAPSSHRPTSGTTDPSFFAGIYTENQAAAAQQSHLIESIVRQSQKASASSGDISLPRKGRGRKVDPSSATDVSSSMIPIKPGNQQALFSDGASEITTPRKSTGAEWDVPSSAEGATAPKSAKSARHSARKTYGKQNRRGSKPTSEFIVSDAEYEMPTNDAPQDSEAVAGEEALGSSPLPTTSRRKVSLHDSVVSETTNFYVAQSNLTTMQKLEYQKVNTPPIGNQKSSGTTTVAYSTPSRYASSGPPLPWERPSVAGTQLASTLPEIVDVGSSPDALVSDSMRSEGKKTASADTKERSAVEIPPDSPESPLRKDMTRRRHRTRKAMEEIDELGQDDSLDPGTTDHQGDSTGPRSTRLRSRAADARNMSTSQRDEPECDRTPEQVKRATAEPVVPEEVGPKVPKKRGRKKKQQPALEKHNEETPDSGDHKEVDAVESASKGSTTLGTESVHEKPKRKRGRPRKTEAAKAVQSVAEPSLGVQEASLPLAQEDTTEPVAANAQEEDSDVCEPAFKRKKSGIKNDKEGLNAEVQVGGEDSQPLREVDVNARSPSKPESSETPGAKAAMAHGKETPKMAASQAKAPYRVGLSKRSRIAPLLKVIRK
ncbi:hypothetical protein F4780DRAFT_719276 [Xylariomycetidae sp. FL0641]|nr:hypothetical protein F4780DRAFT_719276 [Xylariomycetidae sp. FL0641]